MYKVLALSKIESFFLRMSTVSPTILVKCGCIKKIAVYPSEDKEYIEVKKQHLAHVLTELVLHSNENLVGIKPCYGKQHTSVNIFKSVCVSHSRTLKRLQENIIAYETRENTYLRSNTPNPLRLRDYVVCSYDVCKLFHTSLTNLFPTDALIPIQLIILCIKSEQQSLTFLEEIFNKYNE